MVIIKRIKLIGQNSTYDCGIACLLTIIRYYKSDVSKEYLKQISMTTKEGTSMYGLINAANILGFKAIGKKGSVDNINKKNIPFIAHIKINEEKGLYHYVIVSNITRKKITLKDPSCGTKEMKIDEFKKITTNNYLFIYKTEKIKKITKEKVITKNFKNLILKNKNLIIMTIIILLINITLELLNIFSLKIILNNAIIVESLTNLKVLLIIFTYLLILKVISSFTIQLTKEKLKNKFNYDLKKNLISHLLSLPYLYYKEKEKGTILSLFKDIDILTEYITSSIFTIVCNTTVITFIYIYFSTLSKTITFVLIISNILLLFLIYHQKQFNKKTVSKYYKENDLYNNKLNLIINNNEKVKGLHLENILIKNLKTITSNTITNNYKLNYHKELLKSSLNIFEGLIYLLVIGLSGCIIITTTKLSLTTFLLLESILFISLRNVESLYLIFFQYENYKIIKERLNDVFYYEKEKLLSTNKYNYKTNNLTIAIRNLSFKYYDNLVLDNINLKINAKDKVFIYGESGSGKSTLVKILCRYLPIKYNHIKLGEIDLTHYNLSSLRNLVTYITVDDMLSNTSIKENIYLSRKPEINQSDLLKITALNKMFKEKNYTINTVIEENGNNLSMGEKSRVNLAQALFKQSEIYILDECLSNVDINLEREILSNILKFYKDKIIIYISHRLSNKDLFNRVIYINKGKCYEKN